jgi:hypothetical protein
MNTASYHTLNNHWKYWSGSIIFIAFILNNSIQASLIYGGCSNSNILAWHIFTPIILNYVLFGLGIILSIGMESLVRCHGTACAGVKRISNMFIGPSILLIVVMALTIWYAIIRFENPTDCANQLPSGLIELAGQFFISISFFVCNLFFYAKLIKLYAIETYNVPHVTLSGSTAVQ